MAGMGCDSLDEKAIERGERHKLLPVAKTCACGRHHPDFCALPSIGTQRGLVDDEGRPYELRLANCPCGSTLALEVAP